MIEISDETDEKAIHRWLHIPAASMSAWERVTALLLSPWTRQWPRPPVYVRWWPLVRTLSLRPAAGVPLAALWDFHTLNWNVWNSRCHFRKLFTLGEPCIWVWVYVCMCVFYYRSTSDRYRFSLGLSRIKSCLILLFGIFWLHPGRTTEVVYYIT